MGAWGPGIYQDDVAQDVRDDYIELLKKEVSNEEAVELIKESYMEEIEDEDDQSVFWIALADTMWKVGRLTEEVKQKALEIIENKQDLEKWKESQNEYEKRKEILEQEKEKLESPMPKLRIYKKPRPYKNDWKIGDTFAYLIEDKEAKKVKLLGRYLILRKVGEDEYTEGKIYPIITVQITEDDQLPKTVEEIRELVYIISSNDANIKYSYCMEMIEDSKRIIPKKLIYLGNFNLEELYTCSEQVDLVYWKFFEWILIEKYTELGTNKKPIYQEIEIENIEDEEIRFLFRVEEYKKNLEIEIDTSENREINPFLYVALIDSMCSKGMILKNKYPIEVDEARKEKAYEEIENIKEILEEKKIRTREKEQYLEEVRERIKNYGINWRETLNKRLRKKEQELENKKHNKE